MTQGEILKACPFCGGAAALQTLSMTEKFMGLSDSPKQHFFYRVGCLSCGTKQGYDEAYPKWDEDSEANAIDTWNNRAEIAHVADPIRDELQRELADSRGVCTDCDDTGITIQTERICCCHTGQAERLGRELAKLKMAYQATAEAAATHLKSAVEAKARLAEADRKSVV